MENNTKKTESNIHKWDRFSWMKKHPSKIIVSMDLGNKFLVDCKTVEDWGTGEGLFKIYRADAIGIDGSDTPGADKKFIDLTTYKTRVDGIFLRHVLEHNFKWEDILNNALESIKEKLCVVMFLPFSKEETMELYYHGIKVPDLSISEKRFFRIVDKYDVSFERYKIPSNSTPEVYEELIYITKK